MEVTEIEILRDRKISKSRNFKRATGTKQCIAMRIHTVFYKGQLIRDNFETSQIWTKIRDKN